MKKSMIAIVAMATACAFADNKAETNIVEQASAPILWGFGNYGFYSGYQLYGSLVNRDPVLQGYFEMNGNLPFEVGSMENLGYLGAGVWSNSDLTGRRRSYTDPSIAGGTLRGAFNEWDFNIHWGKTFWIDDNKEWGIDYRTSVVWYYYPPAGKGTTQTKTTFDWNHSFAVVNKYVIPFLDVVHEYTGHGTLLQFGLKRDFTFFDALTITPAVAFVGRNSRYNWCFPTRFGDMDYNGGVNGSRTASSIIATAKVGVDATYMITDNIGLFAKFAFCSMIDPHLRDNACEMDRGEYGKLRDFAWGGAGVCFNF